MTPLLEVPEWYDVCLRYRYNIFAFAVEALGIQPTWQQKLLFDSVQCPGSRTSVASGHGCFGKGTLLMRADGRSVAVEDVHVGDRLMGDDGQSTREVLELKRGQQAMYRFTYADGTSHVFNESHILCLVATNSKGTRQAGQKITVTVAEWLKWGEDKKRCHAIYRSPVKSYAGADHQDALPIPPYLLGVWLGDGHSTGSTFTTADAEILQVLQEQACVFGCELVSAKNQNAGKATTWNMTQHKGSATPFGRALSRLKLPKNKHIPDCYLYASLEDRKQLLAGLIDTDGALDGCSYDFVQKKTRLAHQVMQLARSIGCHATIRKVSKTCGSTGVAGDYWRVTIGRNTDLIPVRIARKKRPDKPHQRRNLHFSIRSVEPLGVGDYYGFVLDGNSQFLGADFTVLHNTGKTSGAGVVALWHLLFFPESVMMFTAPQIGQLRKLVWKEISISLARLKSGHLAWLADYVEVLAETVYIRGYDKTWHVFAKTAPKNAPTNLAGLHGDHYMVWGDEASGIEDQVYDVIMGALTHESNRAVLTSQPTRNSGFFFDTHHKLSYAAGGVWNNLVFNGELSPLVSESVLYEMLQKYGSREDAGYLIRVRGEFADRADEFLVTRRQSAEMFVGTCLYPGKHDDYGYLISVDVGGGVGRDDSVICVARVWGETTHGERARRVEVIDIPLCSGTQNFTYMAAMIEDLLATYNNANVVLDANGVGAGLAQQLKDRGIFYKAVNWGGPCFKDADKKYYFNKRSQAIVDFSHAAQQGRFKILDAKYRVKIEDQVTRLPFGFDDQARYKVWSKDEMKRKGLRSPDVADTFAFLFLAGVMYTSAESDLQQAGSADDDAWALLDGGQ